VRRFWPLMTLGAARLATAAWIVFLGCVVLELVISGY
jgi:hypothetical protein